MECLKAFVQQPNISETSKRIALLQDVNHYMVSKSDLPDSVICATLAALIKTLGNYLDTKSRKECESLLGILLRKYESISVKFLLKNLEAFANPLTTCKLICRSLAGKALCALSWCNIIAETCCLSPGDSVEWSQIVRIQSFLYFGIQSSCYQQMWNSAKRKLYSLWKKMPDAFLKSSNILLRDQESASSCVLLTVLVTYDRNTFLLKKEEILHFFVKAIVMCKVSLPQPILLCFAPIIQEVGHTEYEKVLHPALQKGLLRNPENMFPIMKIIYGNVSIDLSRHGMDLLKMLIPQLLSKVDESRCDAVVTAAIVAKQCSDTSAIGEVVTYLFQVLKGSQGKLTTTTQKIAILEAIGGFSEGAFGDGQSASDLAASIAIQFIPFLQLENHEGTLISAVTALGSWCKKVKTNVPKEVVDYFLKMTTLKSVPNAVRVAYITCFTLTFKSDTLSQVDPFIPFLLKCVEKTTQQNPQTLVVCEALCASEILVKVESVELKQNYNMANFWSTILNPKSAILSTKFIHNCSEDALMKLQQFIGYIFVYHQQKIHHEITKQFIYCMIYMLLHKSWLLRRETAKTIKKIYQHFSDISFCKEMLEEFFSVLRPSLVINDFDGTEGDENKFYIQPKIFLNALLCLTNIPKLKDDSELAGDIALFIMEDCFHPCISELNNHVWTDYLYYHGLDAYSYIKNNKTLITETLIKLKVHSKVCLKALAELIRIAPDLMLPEVREYALGVLQIEEFKTVSSTDVKIMETPDGELWNESIVKNIPQITQNKNVKRENKAYSYKEQKDAEDLQRELDLKRKNNDGASFENQKRKISFLITNKNLSKKQIQLIEEEATKEKNIRTKLSILMDQFTEAQKILQTSMEVVEKFPEMCQHLVPLIKPIVSLFCSELLSSHAQHLYVSLSRAMMYGNKNLGLQIAFVTIRMSSPAISANLGNEPLPKVVSRILMSLCSQNDAYSIESFAFIFPFINAALQNCNKFMNNDPKLICNALELILKHVCLRQTLNKSHLPELLPFLDILKCMCQLLGSTTMVQVQQSSSQVLLETCSCISKFQSGLELQKCSELLLSNLMSSANNVRTASIKGLLELEHVLNKNDLQLIRRLWVAMHEEDENISGLAKLLWDNIGVTLDGIICMDLLNDVQHYVPEIQQASAGALSAALKENDSYISTILSRLFELYVTNLERPPPVLDQLGRVISESPPDQFQNRIGLAFALKRISPLLNEDQVQELFSFYVPDAIGDRNSEVRGEMLKSALEAVNDHGKSSASGLLSILEEFLRNAPTSESYDVIRQNVVILLGTLARHLNNDDPKIKPIVAKLTETLSTPSQAVQEAVANCLPPLVPAIKQQAPDIVLKLLAILLDSDNYGERKGAAYGLAGMVKGLGIISFKQHDIMGKLTEAIQDKKNYRHREGALMAFEMFCGMLGRLFEPYVVHVLPHLLICFGDGNQYVREAADNTARAVMRNLSAHGVRLILPSLLNALNEDTWRTKTGSAELLGAMAFCAPKQLSSCLPSIVPKLCEVLTDSHPKVQHAGQQALKQIGSVIRNPEIQAISHTLLAALSDPSKKTTECLQTLLNTKFVHFIDAPSLALILPVVERAFQDRSIDTRKMAAQIIGNMYSLTNQKDLNPYLPAVIPGLKNTLLDPVPEVRAIAAKALGAMVKETGESQFKELLPWLMENLVSEMSSVDRSGAAQGLSEVLAALGTSQLTKLMPEVIRTADEDNIMPHIREGYILLFVYLPCTFGDDFIPYIGDVIPPILKALADENEFVRATALCAGQRIITMYSDTAIPFLLPQLEKGLFDDNWRIRLSSIQLLGDLLYQIIGVTGKMSAHGEDDDNFGTAEGFKSLVQTLGQERRDLVLSGLYMGRSDVALRVRQSSLHVWKIIVPNTPRVLREILPTLFKLLLGCLASSIYDKRQVAAKTLGDIVRKLGERMLPELIPILERGLHSDDPSQREGVCIGLTEIIQSCSRDAIIVFTDNLVPTVRKALCDPLDGVRSAAASTFEHLHNTIGVQALDEILPSLLHSLNTEEQSAFAVDGLRQIISVKGRVVLPFIIPKLIEPPINTEVLAVLSSVAGEALTKHLPILLRAILTALKASLNDPSQFEIVMRDCAVVITSVEGEQGTRAIIDDLLAGLKNSDKDHRYACIILLRTLCMNKEAEFSDYVSLFMQSFIKLLADNEDNIKTVAWDALAAVTSTLDPADMQRHVSSVRNAIRFVKSDDVVVSTGTLPGFCIPKKGLSPVLPIFREGILNGSPDLKEQSVRGLSECIVLLTPAALKPSVVQITGPLIRILGDRFSSNIRIAFLETLSLLLQKVGIYLKPFLPQLQTTFTKALQDVNREIRIQAATALGHLTTIHPRVDPLFADLNNNINNAEETSFKETMLQALRNCINLGGKKVSPNMKVQLLSTLVPLLSSEEETVGRCAAGCLGNLCLFLEEANVEELVTKQMLVMDDASAPWCLRQSRSALLSVALKEAYNTIYVQQWKSKILGRFLAHTALDRVQVKTHGIHSAAYLLFHLASASNSVPTEVIDSFKNCIEGTSNDVKVEACKSLSWVIEQCEASSSASKVELNVADSPIDETTLLKLISMIIPLTREKNTSVKSSGEFTLVSLLGLRHGELLFQKTVGKLSAREGSSLNELLKQKLKKIANTTHKSDIIDNTILQT